jgi:hypothetical protein
MLLRKLNLRENTMPKELTDHELLIAHSIKIDNLCTLMNKIDQTLTSLFEKQGNTCVLNHNSVGKVHKEIFEKVDKKIDTALFVWVVGIIVVVAVTIAGVASTANTKSSVNKDAIHKIEKRLEGHQ